jgi:hypothetical protein
MGKLIGNARVPHEPPRSQFAGTSTELSGRIPQGSPRHAIGPAMPLPTPKAQASSSQGQKNGK